MKTLIFKITLLIIVVVIAYYAGIYNGDKSPQNSRLYTFTKINGEEKYPTLSNDSLYYGCILYDSVAINDEKIAYDIARIVVSRFYGEDCFLKELPIDIRLYNDSVWIINGNLPSNKIGGAFGLILDKKTGGIISIMHEK